MIGKKRENSLLLERARFGFYIYFCVTSCFSFIVKTCLIYYMYHHTVIIFLLSSILSFFVLCQLIQTCMLKFIFGSITIITSPTSTSSSSLSTINTILHPLSRWFHRLWIPTICNNHPFGCRTIPIYCIL